MVEKKKKKIDPFVEKKRQNAVNWLLNWETLGFNAKRIDLMLYTKVIKK